MAKKDEIWFHDLLLIRCTYVRKVGRMEADTKLLKLLDVFRRAAPARPTDRPADTWKSKYFRRPRMQITLDSLRAPRKPTTEACLVDSFDNQVPTLEPKTRVKHAAYNWRGRLWFQAIVSCVIGVLSTATKQTRLLPRRRWTFADDLDLKVCNKWKQTSQFTAGIVKSRQNVRWISTWCVRSRLNQSQRLVDENLKRHAWRTPAQKLAWEVRSLNWIWRSD